ncbi:uncharacterized protein LOC133291430 [Gastrolobium bilobum]|uniref:uncharacterized protein LOC133291430 n=1 Tax=Gastrolobium bilobum TaxID=150636 RepID=UPI002AB20419|nr:uncharacterized protein LOC133291430 [Gastrolobium bilobum]
MQDSIVWEIGDKRQSPFGRTSGSTLLFAFWTMFEAVYLKISGTAASIKWLDSMYIWHWRNEVAHDSSPNGDRHLARPILDYLKAIQLDFIDTKPRLQLHFSREVSWLPPVTLYVKLNIDGASKGQTTEATCGRLLQDHRGVLLNGFTARIGHCAALQAELWGVLKRLELALEASWRNVLLKVTVK